MHGIEFLDKAISQLDNENRDDFIKYLDYEKSLNPANMFICKSKKKVDLFFTTLLIGWKNVKKFLIILL